MEVAAEGAAAVEVAAEGAAGAEVAAEGAAWVEVEVMDKTIDFGVIGKTRAKIGDFGLIQIAKSAKLRRRRLQSNDLS